ncbi:hypothetical protein HanHA300_Chr17g0652911 [Helianthus annuus]|nr:hypothetical protein HanHA300_Chr17g0652911 [Helianthus annuus]KAJ0447423.1 hypothetical protein HanHA89_Chr17g0705221 [Helianthus annuus]KAJ0632303.1 hypothetical protein HanLR1_Chr17g0663631 [Helianthus annuus]
MNECMYPSYTANFSSETGGSSDTLDRYGSKGGCVGCSETQRQSTGHNERWL